MGWVRKDALLKWAVVEETTARVIVGHRRYKASVKFLFLGEVDVIAIDLYKPVTLPVSAVEEINELVVLIVRHVLRDLGVSRGGDYEPHIRVKLNPDSRRSLNDKNKRYSVLLELVPASVDEGVSPVVHLALVSVDFKNPRFMHVKRIRRRLLKRRLMLKGRANKRNAVHEPGQMKDMP